MPEEKMKVKILDIREVPSGEPTRIGKYDYIVTYQIDPLRTFIVTIPKEEYSEEKLREAIKKAEAERAKWVGRELEI